MEVDEIQNVSLAGLFHQRILEKTGQNRPYRLEGGAPTATARGASNRTEPLIFGSKHDKLDHPSRGRNAKVELR